MESQLIGLFWATLTIFVVSRVGLLVFSRLGDNALRILLVHALSYVLSALYLPQLHAGVTTRIASFATYAIPSGLWLLVDLARMAHRKSGQPAT